MCVPENINQRLRLGAFFSRSGSLMNDLSIERHMSAKGHKLPILSEHLLRKRHQLVY